jgi:tRNA(fMet)-specific endonuclease VapC
MASVRAFLTLISVHAWDEEAAEAHARIRVCAKRLGRSAGAFDIMIAAHAEALRATLVTNDMAVKNLKIDGLKIVSW